MKSKPEALVLALALVACNGAPPVPPSNPISPPPPTTENASAPPAKAGLVPPVAPRVSHVEKLHGREIADDWFWLRNKGTPEVEGYLAAENAYADALLAPTKELQGKLYDEMLSRIKQTDLGVPVRRGAHLYYARTEEGKQYTIHCRKKKDGAAPEEVILDMNELAKTEKFVGLGQMLPSDDGHLLAYTLDTTGFRQYTLQVKDLRTGVVLPDRIPRVDYVAFARDGKSILYVVQHPQTKRSFELRRHVLGEDAKNDALLYEEKDEMFDLALARTRDKAYFVVSSISKTTTEVRVMRADDARGTLAVVAPREHLKEYYVDHRGGLFYIRENGGGRNFRLVTAPVAHPDRAHWTELVAHREGVMLEDVDCFKDGVVLSEREDGLPHLRFVGFKKGDDHRVAVDEALYSISGGDNPEWDEPTFRYVFLSPLTPRSVFDYDPKSRAKALRKRTEVPNYDPSKYETKRVHATAKDGTKIAVSLLYPKGASPDGTHPALLRGYGAYGLPYPIHFDARAFSLVDRGAVVAIAHIRGGGEMGKRWHDEGRMAKKEQTFSDFIAASEELVKSGWAKKDALVIEGGSAGGLLMGAVVNMRPDLFRAVVAHVPFVDVINTMLDETLPLTVSEFEEWGNPKKKDEYDRMVAYSPYDNVEKKAYPAMLVRTAYNDSQVMYWEPAKWVAKLRTMKTDESPLLFKTDMDPAGHGGKSGRYDALRDTALDYAWILSQMGITR